MNPKPCCDPYGLFLGRRAVITVFAVGAGKMGV